MNVISLKISVEYAIIIYNAVRCWNWPWRYECMDQKLCRMAELFCMGFSLLKALEFFVFRKMEMPETKTHLLCGWSQIVIQKNHLSVTIELFRHYCKKGKVILWQKRITI